MSNDRRIRELTAASSVAGSDQIVIDQGSGGAKRATINQVVSAGTSLVYNVLNYGAATTNSATVNRLAIQAAIDAAGDAGGGIVILPEGTYNIDDGLTVTDNRIFIRGDGPSTTVLRLVSATGTAITVTNTSVFSVEDMTIATFAADDTRTGGAGISLTTVGDWRIENVRLQCPWIGINCVSASTGRIYNCTIEGYSGIPTTYGLSIGIKLDATCISVIIRDTNISSGAPFTTGIEVEGGHDTLVIDGSGVTNATKCIYLHNSYGGDTADPRWIRINNCYLEPVTTTGIGIEFAECYDVEVTNIYVCWGLYGLHFAAGCNAVRVRGGIIQLAYQHGILIDAGTNIDIANMHVTDNSQQTNNTYDGIIIAAAVSYWSVTNCRTGNFIWNGEKKQRYGINLNTGASDYYKIQGCMSKGDATAGINDGGSGSNKVVADNI